MCGGVQIINRGEQRAFAPAALYGSRKTAAERRKGRVKNGQFKICFSCKAEKICGSSVTTYSAECIENMRIYIHDKKKFRKILKDIKEKAESGR